MMTGTEEEKEPDGWNAYNYCVSFIDLLGQKDAVEGQGLLPKINSEEEKHAFLDFARNSIGAIYKLQRDAETMRREMIARKQDSGNKKLESRYTNVESYFEKFPPK